MEVSTLALLAYVLNHSLCMLNEVTAAELMPNVCNTYILSAVLIPDLLRCYNTCYFGMICSKLMFNLVKLEYTGKLRFVSC